MNLVFASGRRASHAQRRCIFRLMLKPSIRILLGHSFIQHLCKARGK